MDIRGGRMGKINREKQEKRSFKRKGERKKKRKDSGDCMFSVGCKEEAVQPGMRGAAAWRTLRIIHEEGSYQWKKS